MAANPTTSPYLTLARLVNLRNLIDSTLACKPGEEVEKDLYIARIHILRAIREQAAQS